MPERILKNALKVNFYLWIHEKDFPFWKSFKIQLDIKITRAEDTFVVLCSSSLKYKCKINVHVNFEEILNWNLVYDIINLSFAA